MKIPTLCKNYKDLMLDLRVYGKIISTPQQSIAEKRDSLFKEFKLCKPFPTLEEERYKLSPLVSAEYKINYDKELILHSNEALVSVTESGTSLQTVVAEKPCGSLHDNFSYESQLTDSLRDEIIKKYDLDTGEVFAMGVASTEKKFGSVKFEVSNIYDEDEEEEQNEEGVSESVEVDSQVADDTYEEEYSESEDEEEDYEDEDFYVDVTDDESDEDYEDSEDEEEYEDLEDDSDEEYDDSEEDDESYEDEDSYIDVTEEDSDEDDSDEEYEEESEDSDDSEEEYEDSEDEDLEEEYVEDDEDLDESYEEDDEEYEDYSEDSEEDEAIEEEVSDVEQQEVLPAKPIVKPKFYVPDIDDDTEDVASFIESRQEKQEKVEVPTQESTPVARAPSMQVPTDLRSFLRAHPNCKIDEVLKYFSKREIESEILKGRIIKRNGTLRSL